MKNFVKQLGNNKSNGIAFLCNKFPNISEAKLKEGFVGPQIREVLKDPKFEKELTSIELRAWKAFKGLRANFLGNKRSPSFKMKVENLLETVMEMGCRMPVKIHFLRSHLDFFQQILAQSATSKVKDFTRTFKQWKYAIKAFGMKKCWQTIAGCFFVTFQPMCHKRKSYSKHF